MPPLSSMGIVFVRHSLRCATAFSTITPMPHGIKIWEELCWAIVQMHDILPMETTVQISGVSERQVCRIMKLFQETGRPFVEAATKSGRPSQLTSEEVAASAFNFPQKLLY